MCVCACARVRVCACVCVRRYVWFHIQHRIYYSHVTLLHVPLHTVLHTVLPILYSPYCTPHTAFENFRNLRFHLQRESLTVEFTDTIDYVRKGGKPGRINFAREAEDFFALKKRPLPYTTFHECKKEVMNVHVAKEAREDMITEETKQ